MELTESEVADKCLNLLEVLEEMGTYFMDFATKHDIPMDDPHRLLALTTEAKRLIREVTSPVMQRDFKSPDGATEYGRILSDLAIYIDDLREVLGVSEFAIWAAIGKKSFHATRKEEEKHTTPCGLEGYCTCTSGADCEIA